MTRQDRPLLIPEAIVLAGGLGTRLASLLPAQPKCLAPVLGRPFLFHLLDLLRGQGVRRIVLALGFRADQIVAALETYPHSDLELACVTETAPLGTGGALRNALDSARGDRFLVLNADSYLPFNLQDLLAFHETGGWKASLLSAQMNDAGRYGLLSLGGGGRILDFCEKKPGSSGPVNAGVYLIERDILAALPQHTQLSLEKDVMPGLAARGELGAMVVTGSFLDIGTPEDYARAEDFLGGLCGSKVSPSSDARSR